MKLSGGGDACDKNSNPGLCRTCEEPLFLRVCAVGKLPVVVCAADIGSVVVFLGTKESLSNPRDGRFPRTDSALQLCSDWTP